MRTLRLMSRGHPAIVRRIAAAIVVGWAVPAVLVVVSEVGGAHGVLVSFLSDLGVHARSLVAVPALILAEPDCLPWLRRIVRTFVTEEIVAGPEIPKFEAALASARRHLDSGLVELLTFAASYGIVVALLVYFKASTGPAWQLGDSGMRPDLSPAGWWYALVSVPILLVLFLGWLARVAVWGVFLARVARLQLRLVASHPDGAGGLHFLSTSLRGFRFVSMATGTMVAGSIANQVLQHNLSPFAFRRVVIALLIVNAMLFAGPLLVFVRTLRETKRRAIFGYGTLAADVGRAFEGRWLRDDINRTAALDASDFSATTDLYSIVANVHGMRDFPFRAIDLLGPVGGAALPLLPVALLAVPMSEIVSALAEVLL